MTGFFAAVHRLLCASSLGVIASFLVCTPAQAQATWTASDGYTAFSAYTSAFYFDYYAKAGSPSGANLTDGYGWLQHEGNYDSSNNPDTGFWRWAEQIEMTEDAYDNATRNGNSSNASSYKTVITQLCDGFIDKYGDSWAANNLWNDDLSWATIAFDRAYEITGNTRYHSDATTNLGSVWQRGQYSYTANGTTYTAIYENSCTPGNMGTDNCTPQLAAVSNFTFVIAAEYLRKDETDPDSGWQNEANTVMAFAINNLWDSATGQVYNSLDYACGTACSWSPNTTNRSYNFGVAIGALVWHEDWNNGNPVGGYNDKAQLIATHLSTELSTSVNPWGTPPDSCAPGTDWSNSRYYGKNQSGYSTILPIYCSYNSDAAGFNGIALRWVGYALRMNTFNTNNILTWAQQNVDQAWANIYSGTQTNSQNLSWNDWIDPTPASTSTSPLYSWDCSDLVVGMMDIPN